MVLRGKKLEDLTHAEVVELLGEPEEKGFPAGANQGKSEGLVFFMQTG
jgi:hypothetical protein